MKSALFILLASAAISGCTSIPTVKTVGPTPGEKNLLLQSVPRRIIDFHASYVRDGGLASGKFWLWDYANFLEALLREVNQAIGDGDTLSPEHLKAIATFADVETVTTRSYVYPLWRGASGYDAAHAQNVASLYENILRDLVVAMGRSLTVFHATEKDWTEDIAQEWTAKFNRAVQIATNADPPPARSIPPLTPRSAAR